jgi:hypothetical protein
MSKSVRLGGQREFFFYLLGWLRQLQETDPGWWA